MRILGRPATQGGGPTIDPRRIVSLLVVVLAVLLAAGGCPASQPPPNGRCDLSGTSGAERFIIGKESGGDPTADNPHSSAFGLGQLIEAQRRKYLARDYNTTDCDKQLAAFRAYVHDRYGDAEAAQAFWLVHHWY